MDSTYDSRVRERIDELLKGDIRNFAEWMRNNTPLTGEWWGPEEAVVDARSVAHALTQYLDATATQEDLLAWANFLIWGGSRGLLTTGSRFLLVPVTFPDDGSLLGGLVSEIDIDGCAPDDARRHLARLAPFVDR